MAGVREVLLEVDLVVAEGVGGLGLCGDEHLLELFCALCHAHALAAAAGRCLDQHGVAHLCGEAGGFFGRGDRAVRAGDGGHAEAGHGGLGVGLVSQLLDGLGRGADEGDVVVCAGAGELGAFREEAVAGVDGLRAGDLGCADDVGDHQIGLGGRRRADADGLVRELDGQGVAVCLGVDHDGLDAQLVGRADDAHGHLAAVCNEDLVEHRGPPTRRWARRRRARCRTRRGRRLPRRPP